MTLEQPVKHFRRCAEQHHKDGSPCRARMYECDAEITELKIQIRELQDEKKLQADVAGYEL